MINHPIRHHLARRCALAAALVLAVGGLPGPVQAARLAAARGYFNVVMPPAPLCENQSYPVLVSVLPGSRPTAAAIKSRAEAPRGLSAISVDALVQDASIGFIDPAHSVTGLADLDELESQPGVIYFQLYTKKAGATQLVLQATVKGEHVNATVPLTVEHCEVEVTALSTWHVPGEANLGLAASIHRAPLNADESGRLSGTGLVKWFVVRSITNDCDPGAALATTSRATLTGQQGADGQISVNVVYDPTSVPLTVTCANAEGSITGSPTVIVTPRTLNLQAPAGGSTALLSQILDGPEPAPGEAAVVVRPLAR